MPVSSLKFRMTADNQNVLSSFNQVRTAASSLGTDLQKHIGDKLAGIFSIGVIEQVVQRTGQWADELVKASRELGMGVEEMQALDVMFRRAGVSSEKLFNYYNKLEAAAVKAANGNETLRRSFLALGVDITRLKGPNRYSTAELFQQTLTGMGTRGTANEGSVQSIFGAKNYFDIQALARESGGRTIGEYKTEHAAQIVPAGEVSMMTKAWRSIIDDVQAMGTALKPLVGILLVLVDGVAKMVRGIITAASDAITSIPNLIKHPLKTLGEGGKNLGLMGRGLIGMIPGATTGVNWVAKKLGGGEDYLSQGYGNVTEERKRSYAGAGEAIGMGITFGVGAVTDALGLGAKGIKAGAGFAGMEGLSTKAGGWAKKISNFKPGKSAMDKLGELTAIKHESTEFGFDETMGKRAAVTLKESTRFNELKTFGKLVGIGMTAMAGGIGAKDVLNNPFGNQGEGDLRPDRRGPLGRIGGYGAGGGSSNISLGGVFGVDIQSKIMTLNSKMVDLLQQIVINTTPDVGGGSDEGTSGFGD